MGRCFAGRCQGRKSRQCVQQRRPGSLVTNDMHELVYLGRQIFTALPSLERYMHSEVNLWTLHSTPSQVPLTSCIKCPSSEHFQMSMVLTTNSCSTLHPMPLVSRAMRNSHVEWTYFHDFPCLSRPEGPFYFNKPDVLPAYNSPCNQALAPIALQYRYSKTV